MNTSSSEAVQVTADGLVQLRTTSPLARRLGIESPYDRLFATPAGAELARTALALDPVYEVFNLVRYAWFKRQMEEASSRFSQLVILGAGHDTRSLALTTVQQGTCRAYEIDYGSLLSEKRRILHEHGVALPAALAFVACDLNAEDPCSALQGAGFDPGVPSAVFMEGVFFFLQSERALSLLDPWRLGMSAESALWFDAWTLHRTRSLNRKLVERTGRALFGEAALGDAAPDVASALAAKGYAQSRVRTLEALCEEFGVAEVVDSVPQSWLVIRAQRT